MKVSRREQQRVEKPVGLYVNLIFLCLLVQSPCSIPLITVPTVSTFNPSAHTSPEQQKPPNSLVYYFHGCIDQSEHSACLTRLRNCPLWPTGSTFVQRRPEQSSEYRSTRPTLVYFIVQLSNCGFLTVPGNNPQPAIYRDGSGRRRPKHESFLCPFHLHVSGPVG